MRLTGGEPLARLDLPVLVRMIAEIARHQDISLTTNAILLERFAAPLKQAGLTRVNISLDITAARALRAHHPRRLFRSPPGAASWPPKPPDWPQSRLNVVAMRNVNHDELLDLARLAVDHPWHVRFIEIMPVKNQAAWGEGFPDPQDTYIPIAEIKEILAPLHLEPASAHTGSGPAREYTLPGGKGRIGFISPVSDHFCQECNRLRLTADGHLRPCLLSDLEVPVLQALHEREPLFPLLQQAADLKPQQHELELNHFPNNRCMNQIGG